MKTSLFVEGNNPLAHLRKVLNFVRFLAEVGVSYCCRAGRRFAQNVAIRLLIRLFDDGRAGVFAHSGIEGCGPSILSDALGG